MHVLSASIGIAYNRHRRAATEFIFQRIKQIPGAQNGHENIMLISQGILFLDNGKDR